MSPPETRTLSLRRLPMAEEKLSFFRYGEIGGRDDPDQRLGAVAFLGEARLRALPGGHSARDAPSVRPATREGFPARGARHRRLRVARAPQEVVPRLRAAPAHRHHDAALQPELQVLPRVPDGHGSRRHRHVPRDREARRRHAMQSTSPSINFEFQGGEPTANFDAIKFVVEYSREKNKYEKKELVHSLVTNMTFMTEERPSGSSTTTC